MLTYSLTTLTIPPRKDHNLSSSSSIYQNLRHQTCLVKAKIQTYLTDSELILQTKDCLRMYLGSHILLSPQDREYEQASQ